MRQTLLIALNELRLLFQERGIWLNLIIIPFIVAVASGFANGQAANIGSSGDSANSADSSDAEQNATASAASATPTYRLDVLDEDGGTAAAAFLNAITAANASIVLCPQTNTADDFCQLGDDPLTRERAGERLNATTLALLVIPAGFSDAVNAGEAAGVQYVSNVSLSAPGYLLEAVNAAAEQVGGVANAGQIGLQIADATTFLAFRDEADRAAFAGSVRENAATLYGGAPFRVVSETAGAPNSGATSNGAGGFSQSIPGMASMYVMFAIFPAAAAFLRERKAWLLQRMVTLPLTRAQVLGGRLLARFTIGMIQYAVMFLFGLVLGVRYGSDLVALLALMVAFALCITALMTMLSTFLRSEGQAQGITLFLTLTLAPLGGAWWPLEIVPQFMRTIGQISPVAWVMNGFRDLIFYGGNLATVWPNIAVLLVAAVVFFAVGVARFRFD